MSLNGRRCCFNLKFCHFLTGLSACFAALYLIIIFISAVGADYFVNLYKSMEESNFSIENDWKYISMLQMLMVAGIIWLKDHTSLSITLCFIL